MIKNAFVVSFNGIGNWIALTPVLRLLGQTPNDFGLWCCENPFFRSRELQRHAGLTRFMGLYPSLWRRFRPEDWNQIGEFFRLHGINYVFHFRNEPSGSDDHIYEFKRLVCPTVEIVALRSGLSTIPASQVLLTRSILHALETAGIDCSSYSAQWISLQKAVKNESPGKRIVFCTGASQPNKRWSETGWFALGEEIFRESEHAVTVFPGRSSVERQQGIGLFERLFAVAANRVSLEANSALDNAIAVFSKSDLIVANDSYATHLAAAFGIPIVGVYQTTDSRIWGPDWTLFRPVQNNAVFECPYFKPESGNCRMYYSRCLPDCLTGRDTSPVDVRLAIESLLTALEQPLP